MRYQEFSLSDFSGGYSSTLTPDRLQANMMSKGSLDVQLTRTGSIEKRRGFSDVFSDSSDTWTDYNECLGIAQFYDTNTRWLVRIGRDSDAVGGTSAVALEWCNAQLGNATVASNWKGPVVLGNSAVASLYVEFRSDSVNNRLYYTHPGFATLNYISYSGTSLISTPCTTSGTTRTFNKPKGLELWYDRVWTFTDYTVEGGTYLFYSDAARANFDLDLAWQQVQGSGPIVAIKRLRDRLLIFKQREIYVAVGGDDPLNNLRIDLMTSDVGCIAQRSVVESEGYVYWVADKGIYRTDGVNIEYLSKPIEEEFQLARRASISIAHAVHNRKDSQIAFFVPVLGDASGGAWGSSPYGSAWGGGGVAGRALVFDYHHGSWCAPFTNQPFSCSCTFVNTTSPAANESEIVVVNASVDYASIDNDAAGELYIWQDGTDDAGKAVHAKFVTPPLPLGDASIVKMFRKLYVGAVDFGGATPLEVKLHDKYGAINSDDDGSSTVTQTLSEGEDSRPAYTHTRHTVYVSSRNPRIEVSDYGVGGRWGISSFTILYSVKGRRT